MHKHEFEGQTEGEYLVSYFFEGKTHSSWRRGRKCKTCHVVYTGKKV